MAISEPNNNIKPDELGPKEWKFWTYANALSLSRLVIGMFLYYYILQHQTKISIILALLAIATDYADGYVARKRNEVSEFGKVLDPIADKVTIALASIGLYQTYGLPLWIVCIIIGRDILILIGSILLMKRMRSVVASEMPGKIAVSVISVLILSYLFNLDTIKQILLILTILVILYSFVYYLYKFIKMIVPSSTSKEQ